SFHEIPRIAHRSELPTDLGADAEVVFVAALENLVSCVGAEQPRPIDRDLIANTEAVLRIPGADAVVLEGLHHGHLEDELLIQIEEVLQTDRTAESVGAGARQFVV